MNPEKSFNPHNPEYKEVKDLPQDEQKNFVDVEGGFVRKDAIEEVKVAEERAKRVNSAQPSKRVTLVPPEVITAAHVLQDNAQHEDPDFFYGRSSAILRSKEKEARPEEGI